MQSQVLTGLKDYKLIHAYLILLSNLIDQLKGLCVDQIHLFICLTTIGIIEECGYNNSFINTLGISMPIHVYTYIGTYIGIDNNNHVSHLASPNAPPPCRYSQPPLSLTYHTNLSSDMDPPHLRPQPPSMQIGGPILHTSPTLQPISTDSLLIKKLPLLLQSCNYSLQIYEIETSNDQATYMESVTTFSPCCRHPISWFCHDFWSDDGCGLFPYTFCKYLFLRRG